MYANDAMICLRTDSYGFAQVIDWVNDQSVMCLQFLFCYVGCLV